MKSRGGVIHVHIDHIDQEINKEKYSSIIFNTCAQKIVVNATAKIKKPFVIS